MDRRIWFFAAMAVVCFALVPLSDDSFDQVPLGLGVVYVVLAGLFLVEWLTRRNS